MYVERLVTLLSYAYTANSAYVLLTFCTLYALYYQCIDYCELNKKPGKICIPCPVQDQLSGSTIFSTLDLSKVATAWQLPINSEDCAKTAFCPGPGMGLFEFCQMPFGLCSAPSAFQLLMNSVLRVLPFVAICSDDILIHSANLN